VALYDIHAVSPTRRDEFFCLSSGKAETNDLKNPVNPVQIKNMIKRIHSSFNNGQLTTNH